MADKMQITGIGEAMQMFERMEAHAEEIAARSLYAGAGKMANAFTEAANSIRSEKFRYAFGDRKRLPSHEEKAVLLGKTGIAKFDVNGSEVQTSVGIGHGYANINGKSVAVRKIANAINSGTSFMEKQPVFRRAATKTKNIASNAIVQAAEQIINEIKK